MMQLLIHTDLMQILATMYNLIKKVHVPMFLFP